MTVYEKLFGTPERAAETIDAVCKRNWEQRGTCVGCPLWNPTCDGEHGGSVFKWLESEES